MMGRDFARAAAALAFCVLVGGCAANFHQLRRDGQIALLQRDLVRADANFKEAFEQRPEDAENLFDLGTVRMHYAGRQMAEQNQSAVLRELDRAIAYYGRAREAHPGMHAAMLARNEALELRGRYDAALGEAEWAMTFVGPSARSQGFLADELEQRGDLDGALLRHRQAVAMEPNNSRARLAYGRFLARVGDRGGAIEQSTRAYELNPMEAGAARTLAELGAPLPRTTPPLEP